MLLVLLINILYTL